jgi:hypothetical protein
LEASANEDYERVKELGDKTYYLYLDSFFKSCRLISELEELIGIEGLSVENMKYFLNQ